MELLIALVITFILGGCAIGALWFSFGTSNQIKDYAAANGEIEMVVQRLGREFVHIGLGMPNNRKGLGSFASAFAYPSSPPIMALMGASGDQWGGPATIGKDNPTHTYDRTFMETDLTTIFGTVSAYSGPELYYTWGVPTGVKAKVDSGILPGSKLERGSTVTLVQLYPSSGKSLLENFIYDLRPIGLKANASQGKNPASWFLFPTLRVPLLIDAWVTGPDGDGIEATLAADADRELAGFVMGLDEVHLLQVARLYLEDEELKQVIFGADYENPDDNTIQVLGRRIVGLHFTYRPDTRLLTMYIAARGEERLGPERELPSGWPSWLPPLSSEARRYRLAAKSITWRIRN
ncbi:MAG: hypothetical protein LBQ42_00965 [Synergistaceae bacterium]|nr:hypothetical protein [Synergistaceae bacterium]